MQLHRTQAVDNTLTGLICALTTKYMMEDSWRLTPAMSVDSRKQQGMLHLKQGRGKRMCWLPWLHITGRVHSVGSLTAGGGQNGCNSSLRLHPSCGAWEWSNSEDCKGKAKEAFGLSTALATENPSIEYHERRYWWQQIIRFKKTKWLWPIRQWKQWKPSKISPWNANSLKGHEQLLEN